MKKLLTFFFLISIFHIGNAQTSECLVLLDSLKGEYEGACEKGKANGEGKAFGTHFYEGTFKNGYPDGMGKYTWKNGNQFTGKFKKGLKEGKGELKAIVNGKDTAISGYWKKDIYKGEYENPFEIIDITTKVGRVEVNKINKRGNKITTQVEDLQGNYRMTNITVIAGSFYTKSSNLMNNKEITIFEGIVFPFRAIFYFGEHKVEVEIFEEGEWDIKIPLNK